MYVYKYIHIYVYGCRSRVPPQKRAPVKKHVQMGRCQNVQTNIYSYIIYNISIYTYTYIYLSIYIYLSLSLYIYIYIYLSIYLSIYRSIYRSIDLSISRV